MLKKLYQKYGIIMIFNDKTQYDYAYFLINHYKQISKKLIIDKQYHQKKEVYLLGRPRLILNNFIK